MARYDEPAKSESFVNTLTLDSSTSAKTGCAYVTIGEITADPCQMIELPVTLTAFKDIGGFNFCIEFKNTDLTVISARRGDLIDDVDPLYNNRHKWHYFTYRLNPTTDPSKYRICVVGIGEVYSSYPGICIPGTGQPDVLLYIKFYLACDELLRCCDSRLQFHWDSTTCLENTLIDCIGETLLVSDNDTFFHPDSCNFGVYNPVARCVHFDNGRVIFRCFPGDMDTSGTITLSDIVYLINYYFDKDGLGCLGSDPGNCWTPNLPCKGDWNGSGDITLGDIIQAVNYYFNKPGGPWDAVPSGACCLAP